MTMDRDYVLDLNSVRVDRRKYDLGLWRLEFVYNLRYTFPDGHSETVRGLTDLEHKTIKINSHFNLQTQREAFLHELLHVIDDYRSDHPKGLQEDESWTLFRECFITYGQACFENMLNER